MEDVQDVRTQSIPPGALEAARKYAVLHNLVECDPSMFGPSGKLRVLDVELAHAMAIVMHYLEMDIRREHALHKDSPTYRTLKSWRTRKEKSFLKIAGVNLDWEHNTLSV